MGILTPLDVGVGSRVASEDVWDTISHHLEIELGRMSMWNTGQILMECASFPPPRSNASMVRKIFEDDWRSESHHEARLEDLEGIYSTLYFPLTVHLMVTLQRFVTAFSTCSFSPLKAPQRQPLREHPPRHRHILQEQAKSCLSQCPRPPCLLTTG